MIQIYCILLCSLYAIDAKDSSSSSSESDDDRDVKNRTIVQQPSQQSSSDIESIIENINPAYRYSKPVEEHKK